MNFRTISKNQIILLVFLLALLIRGLFCFVSFKKNVMADFADDNAYKEFASHVLEQGPFVLDNHKLSRTSQVVAPGLPWIMALAMKFFGSNWLTIFFLNTFVGAMTCGLIFFLGKEIFDERTGMWAAFWAAFYVHFIKYVPTAGKEIWLVFLCTLVILLMIRIRTKKPERKHKYLKLFLLAGAFSLLAHIDERYFAYSLLLFFFLILLEEGGWRRGLINASFFAFIVILLMVPWLVRNYAVYKKVIVLTVRTSPFTDRILGYKSESYLEPLEGRWYLSDSQIQEALAGFPVKRKNGKEISDDQVQAMKDGILPHRFSKLESFWSVFQILWKPVDFNRGYSTTGYRYDGVWSLKHNLSVGFTYGLLLPFAFWGFVLLFRQRWKIGLFLLSILAYHSLIHMLFVPFTRNRYRIPVDAVIIVVGIYGLLEIFDRLKSRVFRINKAVRA